MATLAAGAGGVVPWGNSPLMRAAVLRVLPLVVAATLGLVNVFSAVEPNLWIVSGNSARLFVWLYGIVLVASAAFPDDLTLHKVGAPLAVLVFAGRGGGFLQLVFDLDSNSLIGAVAERFMVAVLLVTWHLAMAARIGAEAQLAKTRAP